MTGWLCRRWLLCRRKARSSPWTAPACRPRTATSPLRASPSRCVAPSWPSHRPSAWLLPRAFALRCTASGQMCRASTSCRSCHHLESRHTRTTSAHNRLYSKVISHAHAERDARMHGTLHCTIDLSVFCHFGPTTMWLRVSRQANTCAGGDAKKLHSHGSLILLSGHFASSISMSSNAWKVSTSLCFSISSLFLLLLAFFNTSNHHR